MDVEFDCTECGQRLRIQSESEGAPIRCPQCDHMQVASASVDIAPAIPVAEIVENDGGSTATSAHAGQNPYREAPITSNPYAAPQATTPLAASRVLSEYRLARPTARVSAAIVDWLFFVACLLPGFVATNVLDAVDLVWADRVGAFLMLTVVLSGMGYQCWLTATQGKTIGKTLLGIRIVSTEGNPPGFLAGVVLRQWVFAVLAPCRPLAGLFYLVDSLFVFTETRQCIHDLVASTFVVDDMEPSTIRDRS